MLIARYLPLPEPAINIEYSYVQDVYVSDIGCQLVIKVNLKENSCFPFGYCSPVSYNFSGFKIVSTQIQPTAQFNKFEVRLHSYTIIHPTIHRHKLSVVVVNCPS